MNTKVGYNGRCAHIAAGWGVGGANRGEWRRHSPPNRRNMFDLFGFRWGRESQRPLFPGPLKSTSGSLCIPNCDTMADKDAATLSSRLHALQARLARTEQSARQHKEESADFLQQLLKAKQAKIDMTTQLAEAQRVAEAASAEAAMARQQARQAITSARNTPVKGKGKRGGADAVSMLQRELETERERRKHLLQEARAKAMRSIQEIEQRHVQELSFLHTEIRKNVEGASKAEVDRLKAEKEEMEKGFVKQIRGLAVQSKARQVGCDANANAMQCNAIAGQHLGTTHARMTQTVSIFTSLLCLGFFTTGKKPADHHESTHGVRSGRYRCCC